MIFSFQVIRRKRKIRNTADNVILQNLNLEQLKWIHWSKCKMKSTDLKRTQLHLETKVFWFQSWKCKRKRSVSRINKQQLIKSSGNPFRSFSLFTEFSDDGAICIFKYMFTWAVFRRVRKIPKSNYQLRHVCLSLCWFVRPSARNNMPPTGQIFMKFYIEYFAKICRENPSNFIKIWQE